MVLTKHACQMRRMYAYPVADLDQSEVLTVMRVQQIDDGVEPGGRGRFISLHGGATDSRQEFKRHAFHRQRRDGIGVPELMIETQGDLIGKACGEVDGIGGKRSIVLEIRQALWGDLNIEADAVAM